MTWSTTSGSVRASMQTPATQTRAPSSTVDVGDDIWRLYDVLIALEQAKWPILIRRTSEIILDPYGPWQTPHEPNQAAVPSHCA